MARYLLYKGAAACLTVLLIVSTVFVLLRVTSDPASILLSAEAATPEQIAEVRERLGLNEPLIVQYADFIGGVVTGGMAPSYRFEQPSMGLVFERFPATLRLAGAALLLALLVAVPLGVLSAVFRNSLFDYAASSLSFLGLAIPPFWLGTMLILVFSVGLGMFPTSGDRGFDSLVLPAFALAMWPMGQLTRLIRSEMLEVLHEDYVRTARAMGLRETTIVFGHVLRNALLPVTSFAGLVVGYLLSGTVVIENIFAWPGLGRLVLDATLRRDFPLIEASVVFISLLVVGINLLTDLVYAVVDPRIRNA